MKFVKFGLIAAAAVLATGCTRVGTGEVGIRVNASKEVQGAELLPGSWNQTVIGSILILPTKDIMINIENKAPLTVENTPLSDFDLSVVYNVNPQSVAELYSTKNKSFHGIDTDGDVLIMQSRLTTIINNAAYKVVRKYKNLEVADNRAAIEQEIRDLVNEQLKDDSMENSIQISDVQVKNVQPNAEILKSATEFVRSQNELKTKENEIKIAEAESKRQRALAENGPQTIAYMNAQSLAAIAEGVRTGKVSSVVIPYDFKGMVNVGK